MKITKKMLDEQEDEHFRTESYPSLLKLHALKSMYYKQHGQYKYAKEYGSGEDVQRVIKKLEKKKDIGHNSKMFKVGYNMALKGNIKQKLGYSIEEIMRM